MVCGLQIEAGPTTWFQYQKMALCIFYVVEEKKLIGMDKKCKL